MQNSMIAIQFVIFFSIIVSLIFYFSSCRDMKIVSPYSAKELFKADEKLNKESIQRTTTIPKHIWMTISDKSKIPPIVYENLKKYAPQIPYTIFDDAECTDFLTTHFKPPVLKLFNKLQHGAHKADLFRYCLLYVKGGIYLDIKTKLIKPIDKIFDLDSKNTMYTVIDRLGINEDGIGSFYQGIILTPKGNEIFLELISRMVKTGYKKIDQNYAIVCQQMKEIINHKARNSMLVQGNNYLADGLNCYLLREKCATVTDSECPNLDRYGFCCKIYDKDVSDQNDNTEKHVIDTRFANYGTW